MPLDALKDVVGALPRLPRCPSSASPTKAQGVKDPASLQSPHLFCIGAEGTLRSASKVIVLKPSYVALPQSKTAPVPLQTAKENSSYICETTSSSAEASHDNTLTAREPG